MSFPLSFSWYFKFDGPPQVFIWRLMFLFACVYV
jgi:hypothetical protein